MELLHRDLLSLSLQQDPQGRLPQSLLQEIEEARVRARQFVSTLGTLATEIDQRVYENSQYVAEDLLRQMTKQKFYSQWIPKALGGGGSHPLSMYGFNFEMAGYCLGITNLIGAHYVGLGLVSAASAFGVLKKIASDIRRAEQEGSHCIVSAAITEPAAGSDLEETELIHKAKVCTEAKKVEGGYLLNGQKIFISNSSFAKWHIVSCFEDLKNPGSSVTILAVPARSPGVSVGRTERKLGQSASPASVLFFENVFVPDDHVCFAKSQFKTAEEYTKYADCLLNDVLSLSRVGVGGMSAGVLRRTLEILIRHVETTDSQGKKLANYEWVQNQVGKVVENFLIAKTLSWEGHIECYSRGPYKDLQSAAVYSLLKNSPAWFLENTLGRWMTGPAGQEKIRAQRLLDIPTAHEKSIAGWGALAKGACSDMAMESVLIALDIVGSSGSETYWELEKILRDSKLLQIYEGTNELNRLMNYKNFVGAADIHREIFRESL